jgi:Na+-transporting NADH:ubiquinone oxidoreductase subunit F
MTTILYAVLVFTAVVLALITMLIVARKKLVPQGEVKLIINGDTENPLLVQPGSSLLTVLSDKNIFLPSACGGGGTCAMCECHITSGGGDVLPTDY